VGPTCRRGKGERGSNGSGRIDGPRARSPAGLIRFPWARFQIFLILSPFLFSDFRFVSKSFAKKLQIKSNFFQKFSKGLHMILNQ
jgi:hypothetical protein